MIKNLSGGSTINYGPTLPATSPFDGTLFYKTAGDDQGLYIYSFVQDNDTVAFGDQSVLKWVQAQSPGLQVSSSGVLVSSDLTMKDGTLTIFSNNYGTADSTLPMTFINDKDTIWEMTDGTEIMKLTTTGSLTLKGATVWTSANDGLGLGLNADLLQGNNATFYTNATNISTGTLNRARLPYNPVHQGGFTGMGTNEVYIGTQSAAANKLNLAIDSTDYGNIWPIGISGNAATATFATNAQSAVSAQAATNATNAGSVPFSGITSAPTGFSTFNFATTYLKATDAFTAGAGYLTNKTSTWIKSDEGTDRMFFSTDKSTQYRGPNPIPGAAQSRGQQTFTSPGTYSFIVPAGVTEISAVCIGGGGGGMAGVTSTTNTYGGGGAGGGLRFITSTSVTPGETLTVVVGAGGTIGTSTSVLGGTGGTTSISRGSTVILQATGGTGGRGTSSSANAGGAGSTITYAGTDSAGLIGGGTGGTSQTNANGSFASGGGGAGGYGSTTNVSVGGSGGRTGVNGAGTLVPATAGTFGAGGGGAYAPAASVGAGGGGGVGLYGPGANGAAGLPISTSGAGGGGAGSGGGAGGNGDATTAGAGGLYGGGGGGGRTSGTMATSVPTPGQGGAARIIWGKADDLVTPRHYPSTNVGDMSTLSITPVNTLAFSWWTASGSSAIMSLDTGGNLIAAGDITAFSDERVKTDVVNIADAVQKVQSINGVTFTRLTDGSRGTGLIAQELQKVLPEAVHEYVDGTLSVAYGNVVGLLVEAIKELKQEIDELKK